MFALGPPLGQRRNERREKFHFGTAVIIVTMITSLLPSRLASAPTDIHSTATDEPVALYVTLCLWSKERPAAMCREVPLTPGAAGPESST